MPVHYDLFKRQFLHKTNSIKSLWATGRGNIKSWERKTVSNYFYKISLLEILGVFFDLLWSVKDPVLWSLCLNLQMRISRISLRLQRQKMLRLWSVTKPYLKYSWQYCTRCSGFCSSKPAGELHPEEQRSFVKHLCWCRSRNPSWNRRLIHQTRELHVHP